MIFQDLQELFNTVSWDTATKTIAQTSKLEISYQRIAQTLRNRMLVLTKFFNTVADKLLFLLFVGNSFCLYVTSLQEKKYYAISSDFYSIN